MAHLINKCACFFTSLFFCFINKLALQVYTGPLFTKFSTNQVIEVKFNIPKATSSNTQYVLE